MSFFVSKSFALLSVAISCPKWW